MRKHAARVGASLGVILQEMSEELRRAARWLLPTVLLTLAQKAWTSVLSELNSLLLRHLYVPRAIGGALGADLLEALNAIQPLLRCGGGGPTADWLQRRAAPLVATLQLLDTPTGALVAAHAQQTDGSPDPRMKPECIFFVDFLTSSWYPILLNFRANLIPTYLPTWSPNPPKIGPRAIQNPSQHPSYHRSLFSLSFD